VRLLVPGRVRWGILLLLAAAVVVLDLVTKRIVQTSLNLGESRPLLAFLELRYHVNDGAAFGLLSGRQTFILIGVGLALVSVLAYVFIDRRPIAAIAGGLLLGGALGNLVERVAYGRVTDFLWVPFWPTFNVADIFIVAGVGLMALTLILDAIAGERSDGTTADRQDAVAQGLEGEGDVEG
jgi:signal peptidase II